MSKGVFWASIDVGQVAIDLHDNPLQHLSGPAFDVALLGNAPDPKALGINFPGILYCDLQLLIVSYTTNALRQKLSSTIMLPSMVCFIYRCL